MKKSIQEEIARVAYELYEKAGSVHGNDLKNWFEAENSVMVKHERHANEMEKKIEPLKKPPTGYRRSEGFYKKG